MCVKVSIIENIVIRICIYMYCGCKQETYIYIYINLVVAISLFLSDIMIAKCQSVEKI